MLFQVYFCKLALNIIFYKCSVVINIHTVLFVNAKCYLCAICMFRKCSLWAHSVICVHTILFMCLQCNVFVARTIYMYYMSIVIFICIQCYLYIHAWFDRYKKFLHFCPMRIYKLFIKTVKFFELTTIC